MGNELTFSQFDGICFVISAIICGIYLITAHWLTNNIIGVFFCIYAIKNLFLGNFKIGMGLLTGLFFYDIFWVFGTDVMITVAKNIEGPIKLLFPKKVDVAGPEDMSLLGLGDIVIPGIFVSLCMRFDFIKAYRKVSDKEHTEEELYELFNRTGLHYFWACMVGYFVAIVCTIVVMIIFDHGQPALLYLVPGCCGAVLLMGFMKVELKDVFAFDETKEFADDSDSDSDGNSSKED